MNSTKLEKRIAFFTIVMAFLSWMAIKMPMPALPFLANFFHTSSQVFKVSVTLNLLAFAISQVFWGPLSDRFGRRPITMLAFFVAALGTLLAMFADNAFIYVLARFIEGFGVGVSAPVGRAMMADKLEKKKMAKIYAWYAIAALLPPAVGPVIGGYLLVGLGWRYIFAFILLLAILYLLACFFYLPETDDHKLDRFDFVQVLEHILFIAKMPNFWAYALPYALINGFMIAYYAAMPYWYVVHFHMREDHYAWLAFLPIAFYIIASMINNRLLNTIAMSKLLLSGIVIANAIALTILGFAFFTRPSLVAVNIFMTLFSVASGIITPMTNASLMHMFRDRITTLAMLLSGMRVAGSGLLVLVAANISLNSYWPLGIYALVIAVAALLIYLTFAKRDLSQ